MVRVRLSRGGGKKRPYYHIVVVDQKSKRDGKCIERIGSYDPNLENEKRITLKQDRLEYWLNQGAQMSDRVRLLQKYSLDPDNLEKRSKIKSELLEKNRIKKQNAKESEEAPAEEVKAEEVKAEEVKAEEVPAEEVKAEEVKAEEAPAEEANTQKEKP
jgi:small subunit ribosomal protein S16